jgi:hypothetical protein
LSLIYLLALATTEQPPSCCRRVIQTPPSSDIKIARLRFLFVLRLRTGIDLCDQADLAPGRLVTIGSWFSDCIGASSLARRSWIVRVNNHQIGFISTHRKIGHSPSIRPSVKANRTTRTDPRKTDRPRRPGEPSARVPDRPLLKLGPSANRLQ